MWYGAMRSVAAHVAVVGCVAVVYGFAAPVANEVVYVPLLKAAADPSFLPNSDWRLLGSDRLLFSLLFGWLTHWLTLTQVCLVGRVVCWIALANASLRLGSRLGLSSLWAAAVICLWLTLGQSVVAGSWMFGGFEAKCIAYAMLLNGIERLLAQKWTVGSGLVGLAMSFHAAVGLLGGFCAALMILTSVFITRELDRKGLVKAIVAAGAGSSLGWVGLLSYPTAPASPADYEFAVHQRMPFHLDPFTWGGVPIVTVVLMVAVSLLVLRYAFRRWPMAASLSAFIVGMAIEGGGGMLATLLGAWELLMVTPFRLLGLLTPLLFYFLVVKLVTSGAYRSAPASVVALVMLVLFSADAYPSVAKRVLARHEPVREPDRDAACKWLREKTPKAARVLFDPADDEATFDSERASVISWKAFLTPRIKTFRHLIAATAGTDSPARPEEMSAHYNALPCESVLQVARETEASYIVTKNGYSLPLVFSRGQFNVYQVFESSACSG